MKRDYARDGHASPTKARASSAIDDTGAIWRSWYDMPPDAVRAEDATRCGHRSQPFYNNLHCYVRGRLNEKYGDAVQPRRPGRSAPICSATCGRQEWGNIYDVVAPASRALELRPRRDAAAQQITTPSRW